MLDCDSYRNSDSSDFDVGWRGVGGEPSLSVNCRYDDATTGPWALKAVADTALERASGQLRDLLKDLAARLDPFPAFEGMQTIQAVEIEPKGFRAPDKGCVVVCEDGSSTT